MSKIGRNDPCFCNSGRKYKKCCINIGINTKITKDNLITSSSGDERFSFNNMDHFSETQSCVLKTTTHEPFMLMRLYYTIYNKAVLMKTLGALRCVCLLDNYKFMINYHYETKNIGLSGKHDQVPKNLYPIILAKGKIIGETSMVIDLRSFERGCCIIEFLNHYIPRDIAEITHMATYNKMHKVTKKTIPDLMNINYDSLFSEENIHRPNMRCDKVMSDAEKTDSVEEAQELMMNFMRESVVEKPNLIEKYPVHYYEDGINFIKYILKFRQLLAYEHLMGNKSLTMFQLISKIIDDNDVAKKLRELA
jgi:SEC-C motif